MNIYTHTWGDGHQTVYINLSEGFCKVNVYDEGFRKVAELYDLIVFPAYRGRGYGRMLLEAAVEAASKLRCDVLVLWPDSEDWVLEWYKRYGFRQDASYRNYDSEAGWSIDLNQLKI